MKVYVAGSSKSILGPTIWMGHLRKAGHEITFDWTTDVIADKKDAECAVNDVNGVLTADAIIMVLDGVHTQRGTYVEMGIALGAGKPVYLYEDKAHSDSVFMFHPLVQIITSVEDLLEKI